MIYRSAEEVVARCLHQREETETGCDGDHQSPGSLQGLCFFLLDFTQECLQERVTNLNLVGWKWRTDTLKGKPLKELNKESFPVYLCTKEVISLGLLQES